MGFCERDQSLARRLAGMDELAQCSFLLDEGLGGGAPPEGLCQPDYLIPGCQIAIWARIRPEAGGLTLELASDSLLAGGVLRLLRELCDGLPAGELADVTPTFLAALEDMVISPEIRQNGLAAVLRMVRAAARGGPLPGPPRFLSPHDLLDPK